MNKSNSVPRSRSLSKENDAGEWFDDGKKEAEEEEEEEDSNRERQERREKAWQLEDEKRESEVKRKESGE